jgi:hypothetical protein
MLQNRVDPSGQLIRTTARGAWLGNRGVIHNADRQIVRPFKLKAWITCRLEFKGRKRPIMAPDRWTELFFLDEATAFAAGHRPCGECRREAFNHFKSFWLQGNPGHPFTKKTSIQEIDQILHQERIDRRGSKITHEENILELPPGTFVLFDRQPFLISAPAMFRWSPFGYEAGIALPDTEILPVLTPPSIVNTFRAGYLPQMACNGR